MALHFWVSGKVFIADSSSDGSVFYFFFWGGVLPTQAAFSALVDAGTHDDVPPPRTPASTSHGEHRAPPLSRVTRSTPVRRCRTVRLHSLVSPFGRSVPDVPPVPALPPSGTRSLRRTDRPRAQPATGNGCPAALVGSCAVHVATDTYN